MKTVLSIIITSAVWLWLRQAERKLMYFHGMADPLGSGARNLLFDYCWYFITLE